MKTKSKISVYILRSAAAVLLLSCVIVAFSSAITPTATGEPTSIAPYTPGGAPGPWMQAAPVETDHYGGFMDSDGTFAYEGGGYSFTINDNINQFGRFDPVANTWTALAPVPDLNNSAASGVYAPNLNKLFVFGGENVATTTVVNTTRIYDMATNTWSIGAPMPDVRDFMGSGYFNGRIYLVGGYNTGNVDPSFGQVWEYDPVANTFNTSRASMPITMGGPGFGIINGHIYIAGGRNIGSTNLNTLYDYDIAANTWTQRANLPTGINVPGSAVIGGKLWVFGGGDPFVGSGALPKSNQKDVFTPDATNILQIYDPATNTWSSGPTLNQERSFPAGTHVGGIAVAVGGYTGSTTTTSVEINVAGSGTPTPTATATHTPTPTPTGTHTPTATPTATSTATPTATATAIPPPSVTTNAATNVTSFSATLNGTINPNGFPTNVHFEYGTTTGYGSTTVSQNFSGSTTQPVSADISGLSPNITYHFRLVGMNGGGTSFGGDMTFTTVGGPPTVTTNAATSVTSSSATLNGTVNPNGLPTNVHFDYGTTTNYGSSTAIQSYSGSTTQPVSANIPGLSPNTTYHFRLVGTNNGGTSFGYDVTFRFDTNTTGPVIITNAATSVMSSSATLNGTVNPKGLTTSVYFQYGASASYGFTTVAQSYSGSTTQPVSANIPGLGPSTTYHFRLVGVNSGGTSFGNDRTFTTSAAAVPPVITSPATARATVNQLFVYQITATAGATSYTAMPVPAGMTFDGVRGILGGTPMNPGTTQIQLTASNSIGTGMRTLTLTVQSASNPGLTIASGTSITARKGQFFSFEVFTNGASRNARLSATGLPAGVRADAVSGLISGTPTANGSFGVTLTVTDGSVTKTSTLQLVFTSDPAIPVISSPREATLVPGHFFSYRIVDSSQQSGTTFSVTGQLPPGLTLNPVTGVISGVYNPQGDDPLQNGGNPLGNVQTNTHHGSQHASNPLSYFQQRPCTLLKVATRGVVQSGNNQLLGRVNVAGNVSENVMVRAIGPSLRVNGVPLTGRLQNPMLELDHPYSIGRNDDWHTTVIGGIITSNQVAAIQNSHLLNGSASLPLVPTNPLESAIIANALAPGNYSAIVRPKSGTTGTVGSVEFYDLGPATLNLHPTAQLANFSTRSLVQTGNNVMRTDFTLGSRAGTGSPVTILLRAVGPSLSVQGRLLNPTLRLYNGSGVSIAYNDNWMSAPNHQAIVNSGHAPTNNLESAILMTLSAGNYAVVVGGQNNTTGIAQLEAYILP